MRGGRDEWQHDLNDAGDAVGRAFTNLANDAAAEAEKGRKSPPTSDVRESLRLAAVRTRFLDAGEADAFLGTVDPVDENRRVQTHDLLLWEAKRTLLDFWGSGNHEKPEPYYRTVGHVYTSDAKELVAGAASHLQPEDQEKRVSEASQIEARLDAPDAIAFRWLDAGEWKADPAVVHVTDEKTFELQYGLAGPKGAPAGRPVVWAMAGLKLQAPADAGDPHSLGGLSPNPADYSLPYTVAPLRPTDSTPEQAAKLKDVDKSDFVVSGLFRGRALGGEGLMKTPVDLHNRPDLVSYQPAPEKTARIAVQAAAADLAAFASQTGELVIVLDYSWSMTSPYDPQGPKTPSLDFHVRVLPLRSQANVAKSGGFLTATLTIAMTKICFAHLPTQSRASQGLFPLRHFTRDFSGRGLFTTCLLRRWPSFPGGRPPLRLRAGFVSRPLSPVPP